MSFEPKQIQMICLEDLVLENHIYRKFLSLWNLDLVQCELEKLKPRSVITKAMAFTASFFVYCCSFLKI